MFERPKRHLRRFPPPMAWELQSASDIQARSIFASAEGSGLVLKKKWIAKVKALTEEDYEAAARLTKPFLEILSNQYSIASNRALDLVKDGLTDVEVLMIRGVWCADKNQFGSVDPDEKLLQGDFKRSVDQCIGYLTKIPQAQNVPRLFKVLWEKRMGAR